MADEETEAASGLTRRKLIKRGAIAGGTLMWVAPVVQSFTSPAFGQGAPLQSDLCRCVVCIDVIVNNIPFTTCCTLTPNSCACLCCCANTGGPQCAACSVPNNPCSVLPVFASCTGFTPGSCDINTCA